MAMTRTHGWFPAAILLGVFLTLGTVARAANEGQEDLDKATELQLNANSLTDLEKVADLCESALSKGLDDGNQAFAKQLLTSTLYQHAEKLSSAIFDQKPPHQQWPLIRNLAIKDLERALQQNEKLADAQFLLARLYALPGGDRAKAKEAAAHAAELFKDDPPAKSKALALRGALQEDPEQQLADFSAAIKIDPHNTEALQARGLYYLPKNQDEKAAEDFAKLLEADGDNFGALNALAEALTNQQKFDEALKLIERVITAKPDSSIGYTARARIRILQKDEAGGLEDLNKALEIDKNDVAALLMRARYYYSQKEIDKAKADVDQALAIRPGMVQGILMQAVMAAEQGDYATAITNMELLANADPKNPEWRLQMAQFYSADKKPSQAIEIVNTVLKEDAANSVALQIRGNAYLSLGDHAKAVKDLEAALQNDAKNSGVLNNLAWVLSTSPDDNVRDGKKAIELAKRACEVTEYKRPHILSTLAAAYAESGDWENAVKWSTKAVEMSTDDDQEILTQLKDELQHYKDKKPFRERQEVEKEEAKPQRPELEI
jgi:tetratricopeptide (TPR) repeat protein